MSNNQPKGFLQQAADAFADSVDGTLWEFPPENTANVSASQQQQPAAGPVVSAAAPAAAPGTGPLVPESDGNQRRARAAAGNQPAGQGAPASGQPANGPAAGAGAGATGGAGSSGT